MERKRYIKFKNKIIQNFQTIQKKLSTEVAVKESRKDMEDESMRSKFLEEAEIMKTMVIFFNFNLLIAATRIDLSNGTL